MINMLANTSNRHKIGFFVILAGLVCAGTANVVSTSWMTAVCCIAGIILTVVGWSFGTRR